MLSRLGYMKHGEPQAHVLGLAMPLPNLEPDFDEEARRFVGGIVGAVLKDAPTAVAGG